MAEAEGFGAACPHCHEISIWYIDATLYEKRKPEFDAERLAKEKEIKEHPEWSGRRAPPPVQLLPVVPVGKWGPSNPGVVPQTCLKCGRVFVARWGVCNEEDIEKWKQQEKYFPGRSPMPTPRMGYIGETPTQFVSAVQVITNRFVKEKVTRSLLEAGWVFPGLHVVSTAGLRAEAEGSSEGAPPAEESSPKSGP